MSDDTSVMTGTITVNGDDIKLAHSGETRVRLRYWQDGSFEILSVYVENREIPTGVRRKAKLNFTIEGPLGCFMFTEATFMFWTEGGRIVRHRILPQHPKMTVIRDDLEYEGQRT